MSDGAGRAIVVGGGLAGSLMALYLGRSARATAVYEKRGDPRGQAAAKGRSINLAISTRGLHALGEVGLAERVTEASVPMRGRMMHDLAGRLIFQPYGKDESQVIRSVSRAGLNRLLIEEAAACPGVELSFEKRCRDVDLETGEVLLEDRATGESERVRGEIVIGADGAFSAVRARMQRLDRFCYRQDYLEYGYKELTIPPGAGGAPQLDPHALHIWPRRRFMMIALPNLDGSFTCTLFWPFEGPHAFARLTTAAEVRRYFEQWFGDAVACMPHLEDEYLAAPPSFLVTIRCYPWSRGGRVVLVGDACHAVVPFYGQGMNAAFEDCSVLNECSAADAPRWERVFARYQELRKPHVDALADLAIGNFVEMRDHVAAPGFLLKKRVERTLDRLLPGYVPLYSLVTFTRTPYREAVERAARQRRRLAAAASLSVVLVLVVLYVLLGSR